MSSELPHGHVAGELVVELRALIDGARREAARAVNAALSELYWEIGTRVRNEVLGEERAAYGALLVSEVGRRLSYEYGRGFDEKSLRHMLRFAEAFPDRSIVSTLWRQLSWSHLKRLSYLDDPMQREFYAEMARVERWSVRRLVERVDSMLFERTVISKQPESVIAKELTALRERDEVSPNLVFRDPYLLDFLGLADTYGEKELEDALLREVERFLLELGAGFAFVERQKRITVDGDDYYLDLLFFHRRLRRLVVIELKLGAFKPADAGQVQLYLRWLDRHERQPGEEAPVAIILCASKKRETIEYLDLGNQGIHVAEYLTQLPPKDLLRERFHAAIAAARARLALTSPVGST